MIAKSATAAMLVAACGLCHAVPMLRLMPSPLGDARLAEPVYTQGTNGPANVRFEVVLPPGRHEAFTVVAWMRTIKRNPSWLTTSIKWCPDRIQRLNPDLAAGAFGWDGGTNLTAAGGSITVASFPFSGYASSDPASTTFTNQYPRGVYTVNGWSTNAVTLTLGGTDYELGPGTFARNYVPGPAASAVLSGSGPVAVGISKTPMHRFYSEMDGVTDVEHKLLEDESIVTNELAMCTWRMRFDGTNQIYRSDLGRIPAFDAMSQWKTNATPASVAFDSEGYYEVGLAGIGDGAGNAIEHDLWDARVFPWWVSDADLERIHANAVEEIQRRGIPRWRYGE